MRHMASLLRLMLLLAVGVSAATVQAQNGAAAADAGETIPFDLTLARYGDYEISAGDYFYYDRRAASEMIRMPSPERDERMRSRLRRVIFEKMLADQAREQGYTETENYQTFSHNLENDWLSRFYAYHQFEQQFNPTEDELRAAYDARKDEFYSPLSFSFRHIFFQTIDRSEAEQERAWDRAQKAKALIEAGSDFVTVAEQMSDSERKGTVIGPFQTREVNPDDAINPVLEDAVLQLDEGETTDILETRHGYHILQLESLRPESYTSFDSVRSRLVSDLRRERFNAWKQELLRAHWDDMIEAYDPAPLFSDEAAEDALVVTIDGRDYSKQAVEDVLQNALRQRSNESMDDYQERVTEELRNEFIYQVIAAKQARAEGYEEIEGYQVFTGVSRNQHIFQQWAQQKIAEYMEDTAITEEMKREYYQENENRFFLPQEVRAAVMAFYIPDHDEEDKYAAFKAISSAEEKANQAMARLQSGESFAEVAQDLSEHESAAQGGEIGVITSTTDDVIPDLVSRRVVRLEEGALVEEPIRTTDAFYIGKCLEKLERETRPFDDPQVQERIASALETQLQNRFLTQLYNEMTPEDEVEYPLAFYGDLNPNNLEQVSYDPPQSE